MHDAVSIKHLYSLLKCPKCGASPVPSLPMCPQCGRSIVTSNGSLDLLDDRARVEADRFAALYAELRTSEGWACPGEREDPATGKSALWRGRVQTVSEAAQIFARLDAGETQPVIVDVGSGGGWAARYLSHASVIAIDLLDVGSPWAVSVRADMERLPIRTAVADGMLFAASLHYGTLQTVLVEAARVLRPNGLLIVVDSPIYADENSQTEASARSAAYYSKAGYSELANRYHPINATAFKKALLESGFAVERFEISSKRHGLVPFRRRPPGTLVVASRSTHGGNAHS